MKLAHLFQSAIREFKSLECEYALGGGFAADVYRRQIRGTSDIDFLFFAGGLEREMGTALLKRLNLNGREITLFDLKRIPGMNKKSADVYVLVGRKGGEEEGIDLLLPSFAWFSRAMQRAQSNLLDFGYGIGAVPTLTAEDVILAKLDAARLKDKDDINSIFEAHADRESKVRLDLDYLIKRIGELKLSLPEECLPYAPTALRVLAKSKRSRKKSFP